MNTTNMRRNSVIKWITIVAAVVFSWSGIAFRPADAAPIEFTAEEYALSNNDEQGENGWYYCYGHAGGKYYFLTWSALNCRWESEDSTEPYIYQYENGAHPGGSYDSMKLWVAEADGYADVGLDARLAEGNTDGVTVSLLCKSKETGILERIGEETIQSGESCSLGEGGLTVKRGDIFFFVLNNYQTNANDGTDFYTGVRFTKTGEGTGEVSVGNSRVVHWMDYFSDVQGENDWYYCYGTPQKYMYLHYGFMNNTRETGWRAGHDIWYQQITKESMHPGCYRWSTLRVWVAKQDGVISLEGDIIKRVAAGDGVDTAIWFNGEKMVEKHFEGTELAPYSIDNMKNLSVKKGDTIILELHAGENYNSANDYTSFCIEIFWEKKENNFDPAEDYTKYLSVVEREADIIGVIEVPKKDGDFSKF